MEIPISGSQINAINYQLNLSDDPPDVSAGGREVIELDPKATIGSLLTIFDHMAQYELYATQLRRWQKEEVPVTAPIPSRLPWNFKFNHNNPVHCTVDSKQGLRLPALQDISWEQQGIWREQRYSWHPLGKLMIIDSVLIEAGRTRGIEEVLFYSVPETASACVGVPTYINIDFTIGDFTEGSARTVTDVSAQLIVNGGMEDPQIYVDRLLPKVLF